MCQVSWKFLLPLFLAPSIWAQSPPDFSDPIGDDGGGERIRVTFGSIPRRVPSCASLSFTWNLDPVPETNFPINLGFTNDGVDQTTGSRELIEDLPEKLVSGDIAVTMINERAFVWENVTIGEPGWYLLTAFAQNTDPIIPSAFEVFVENTSCIVASSGTIITPTPSPSMTTSSPSSTAEPIGVSSRDGGPNTASVVGGVVGAVILAALVASLLYYRRRRTVQTKTLPTLASLKHRKWGVLSSVDKRHANGSPPFSDTTSAQFGVRFARSRTNSFGRTLEDDGKEKNSPTTDALAYIPELSRTSNHGHAATNTERNGGLAAFTKDRTRGNSLKATYPQVTDDPFADAYRARARRASTLSVPSTAHPSPRISDIPSNPSPVPSSAVAPSISRLSTAIVKPVRKPVPQYEDACIEMTSTQASSPSPVPFSSPHASVGNLSVSNISHLATSVESTSPWLQERAPVAGRNIGLAGQCDGPVHYLIPDPPPPSCG